jgi:hypothetical protein
MADGVAAPVGFGPEMVSARASLTKQWMRSDRLLPPEVVGLVSLNVQHADQSLAVEDPGEKLRLCPMEKKSMMVMSCMF